MGRCIFVDQNEKIKMEIVIGYSKNGKVYCELKKDEKDILEFLGEDLDGETESYVMTVKRPNFKDITEMSKGTVSMSVDEGFNFNIAASRMKKMKQLIIDWDFSDEKGEKIPVSDESIEKLNPSIANLIGEQIDELTS